MKLSITLFVLSSLLGLSFLQSSVAHEIPDSYEFKVILKNSQFFSVKDGIKILSVKDGIKNFQKVLRQKKNVVFKGERKDKSRVISFLDTKKCHLKKNGYILRKRFTMKDDIPVDLKITLKYRGSEFDVVRKNKFAANTTLLVDSKFELDLVKDEVFSRSVNVELGKFEDISDLISLYPIIKNLEKDGKPKINEVTEKLEQVHEFNIFETKVDLGKIKFTDKKKCEASFTFWYKDLEKKELMVSEFSYVCKKDLPQSKDLHQTILGLSEWVEAKPITKTETAYGRYSKDSKDSQYCKKNQ